MHSNRTNKIRLQTSKWQANARQSNRSTNESYFIKPYIKARTSAKVRVVKYHLIKSSKDAWEALTRLCYDASHFNQKPQFLANKKQNGQHSQSDKSNQLRALWKQTPASQSSFANSTELGLRGPLVQPLNVPKFQQSLLEAENYGGHCQNGYPVKRRRCVKWTQKYTKPS